jgi:hypothetical protein
MGLTKPMNNDDYRNERNNASIMMIESITHQPLPPSLSVAKQSIFNCGNSKELECSLNADLSVQVGICVQGLLWKLGGRVDKG